MATVEVRGYVNKPEHKVSGGGKEYNKFTLAVKQKRKDHGNEIEEKVYFNCVDFKGGECPAESTYIGIKGYLTVTGWCKNGKGGANLYVTVTEYEELEQLAPKAGSKGSRKGKPDSDEAPADPFALKPDADLGDGIPF